VDSYSISLQFQRINGQSWWLTCVYGPQSTNEKILFLQELRQIRNICSEPWVIVGDFNLIYKVEDKNNDNLNRSMMGRFRKFINDVGLIDTPLTGRKYTWSNHQTSPTLVRLDRVLCTADWEALFPNHLLQSATSEDSDHYPLILGLNSKCSGKRRFHFESFWPKLERFHDVVLEAWTLVRERSCPFLTFELKLKSTAKAQQGWSAKKVGHVTSQLALAREILHQLEIAQDSRLMSPMEMWLLRGLKKHSLAHASLKRTIARLRSRISWIKEGDANSKLFHMHARPGRTLSPKLCQVLTHSLITMRRPKR
jgi:hypothetical protein